MKEMKVFRMVSLSVWDSGNVSQEKEYRGVCLGNGVKRGGRKGNKFSFLHVEPQVCERHPAAWMPSGP